MAEFSDIWIEQREAARDIRDSGYLIGEKVGSQEGTEEDGPSELAGHAVDMWQRRRRTASFPWPSLRSSHRSGIGSFAEPSPAAISMHSRITSMNDFVA